MIPLWTVAALAAELTLDETLTAADARVPELAVALAALDESQGKRTAARGAFDPKVFGYGSTVGGKEPRDLWKAGVSGETLLGLRYEAGWALGTGEFPDYAGADETGGLGEWRVDVETPLLDGLWWSDARVASRVADLGVDGAEAKLAAARVKLRQEAGKRWLDWASAGRALAIERDLLALAEARAAALTREVEEGTRAPFELLDNERVVLERTDRVAEAEAKLAATSAALGLVLRDASGAPAPPPADRLPAAFGGAPSESALEEDLARASRRPDIVALDARIAAARLEAAAARNGLLPDLAVSAGADVPVDGGPTEWKVGFELSSAAWTRKERGSVTAAQARLRALEEERRALVDGARAAVTQAHAMRAAASTRAAAAREAEARAEELWRLEGRRFGLGDADLFALWQREEVLGKARKASVDAAAALEAADIALEAARGGPEL